MRNNDLVAAVSTLPIDIAFYRAARDAKSVQEGPGNCGCDTDAKQYKQRGGQPREDFNDARNCSDPGKGGIQGARHAPDYAQSRRAM